MNIALTPDLENGVLTGEQERQWLAREAAIGFTQLEAGETVTIGTSEQFKALVRGEA